MILKIQQFVTIVTIIAFVSCKETHNSLTKIDAKELIIDSSLHANKPIEQLIAPYRERVNQVLDSTLAYAPKMLSKDDGNYNSSAGNLMADIILSEARPIFKARTGKEIDFAIFNHGGIRSIISKGKVSARTAYEVMPFENTIVVVELSGKSVREMANFLIRSKRAHPVSGIQLVVNQLDELHSLTINGEPLDENRQYYVATSNYLVAGGDDMGFFKGSLGVTDTDYLIRNAMIDYFTKVDTLRAAVDDRFYKMK